MTLERLVHEFLATRRWSLDELVDRYRGPVPEESWRQWATGTPLSTFPEPSTLAAAAAALDVDVATVVLAAARSAGLAVEPRRRSSPESPAMASARDFEEQLAAELAGSELDDDRYRAEPTR
ncbi:hypothetical protein GCM10007304_37300 [Rhodococcoides trifolii]|uniref:Uncharacterized protein n=1 Tax=Rhodococcoides trifolii TaxID=908250 RepID=A0A917G2W0_9NOCA|nr:hypothetical protein [Rhodococcus trifolii]GGG19939.1 hypothetical protein GCM10007304_37300 [Rhodococcus trifolii]